ncbi:MAG: hypothetical protein R6W02_08260, partial [Halomonas campaniensis]
MTAASALPRAYDPGPAADWQRRVARAFSRAAPDYARLGLTEAPVIVHASSEPFLEWDDLRRLDRMREIVHIDPATGA